MIDVHSCVSDLGDCGLWVGHCRVGWLVRARFLVFLLVLLSFVMLKPQERILVHFWYSVDAAGKTDVEKGVM